MAMGQEALTEMIADATLSIDDWYDLPENEPGEWVDGRLVEDEVPSYVHEFLVALLSHLFVDWIVPRGGLVACSDAKFAVRSGRGRKPDLTVYLPGSRFPSPQGLVSTAPRSKENHVL